MPPYLESLFMPFVAQDWSFEGMYAYHKKDYILCAERGPYVFLKTPLEDDFFPLVKLEGAHVATPIDWTAMLEDIAQHIDLARVERVRARVALALWRSYPGYWIFSWQGQSLSAIYNAPQQPAESFDAFQLQMLGSLYDELCDLNDLWIVGASGFLHRHQLEVLTPQTLHEVLDLQHKSVSKTDDLLPR